jgi:hypothetical protein
MGDLEWLNYISYNADQTLINNTSEVSTSSSIRYGLEQDLKEPLDYFEQYEVDNQSAEVL